MFFHALTFAGSRGSCLNMWPKGVQTSPEGPGKFLYNETNMCDRYSCILYLILTEFALKTLKTQLNNHILTMDFSKQNGSAVKYRMPLRRHNVIDVRNILANTSIGEMISLVRGSF